MKLCIIGSGPWPLEEGAVVTGPSIRLRQFVEPLLAARHEVLVVLLEDRLREQIPIAGALAATALPPEEIMNPAVIREVMDLYFVEAVLGVGSLMPAAAAGELATALDVPCWVDLFGDPVAELHAAQLRQGGLPDTMARDHVWKLMRSALLRGDAFSTVSAPQRHALLGQLGLLGRYGTDWDICRRISEIPCAVPDSWTEDAGLPPFPEVLSELGMNEQSRYVFFSGSWNVWLDETSMAKALAAAMHADEELRFVTCGIPTGPAGEQIRQALMNDMREFRDAGRVSELPASHLSQESALLAWAGACISLDRPIPEAELGSRNRLLSMVRWGARPVISVEAGIEAELMAEGLAAGIVDGNWERAGKEIVAACARTPEEREQDRHLGLDWLRSVTFEATAKPVLSWIARGAPRWPAPPVEGLIDRWAAFPAEPEKLFEKPAKKRWFFS
jgi:hypothetical protein